ncbi:5314_t:CDS:1, partial [Racocetra persica]
CLIMSTAQGADEGQSSPIPDVANNTGVVNPAVPASEEVSETKAQEKIDETEVKPITETKYGREKKKKNLT